MCTESTPKSLVDGSLLIFSGGLKEVEIDECLADEVIEMNKKGIVTYQSCCGHGRERGGVLIKRESGPAALSAGYKTEECVAGLEHLLFIELRPHPRANPKLLVNGTEQELLKKTLDDIIRLSKEE